MIGLSLWASLLAVAAAAALAWTFGRLADRELALGRSIESALNGRWAPAAMGAATSIIVWFVWGTLDRLPVISDEAAYLFQAELFARGAWTAPAPTPPEFFEQTHLLVTPVMAAKYFPGHSLLLAPGALISLPGLPVIVLNGITGALIFALARRVGGGNAALLTWFVWVSCFPAIFFRTSYLNMVTSSAAWLTAWWSLLQWRGNRERRWIVTLAIAVGVVAITRPLTALALALPIAVVVLRDAQSRRLWRHVALGAGVGAVCFGIIPLWSERTTGSPFETPLSRYTRTYIPWDVLGFGVDTTKQAVRRVRQAPDAGPVTNAYIDQHRAHSIRALPRIAWQRVRSVAHDMWYEWRAGLAPFALVGIFALPAAGWFGLAGLAVHIALYLVFAHPPIWTVYYMESAPVLAFLTALGVVRVIEWSAAAGRRRREAAPAESVSPIALAVLALALVACIPATRTWRIARNQVNLDHSYFERFTAMVRSVPDERAVIFVRYSRMHDDNLDFVRNGPDLERSRVWLVHDRGADNARLLAAAPERRAYLFDEASGMLRPLASNDR